MSYRPKDTQERALHRLKIAKGHLAKVAKMVEDDVYCIDILLQLQAIENGLKSTGSLLLENHLKTCVGLEDASLTEVMKVVKRSEA